MRWPPPARARSAAGASGCRALPLAPAPAAPSGSGPLPGPHVATDFARPVAEPVGIPHHNFAATTSPTESSEVATQDGELLVGIYGFCILEGLELFERANDPKFRYFPENDDHMMEFDEKLVFALNSFIESLN